MAILCVVKSTPVTRMAAAECYRASRKCRNSFSDSDRWLVILTENNSIACVGISHIDYTTHGSLTATPEISEEDFLAALN